MGERIGSSIRFGGKLTQEKANELIELIKAECLTVDFDESTGPDLTNLGETFGDWEVNYGNLDALTNFAAENGLAYEHWFDSGPDWNQGFYKRDLTGRWEDAEGTPDNPLFSAKQIKQIGFEKLDELVEWFAAPIGPLEIAS